MGSGQDSAIQEALRRSELGPFLVDVRTERDTGEVTWARFRNGQGGSITVDATWDVQSTIESITAELEAKARERLTVRDD